MGYNVDWDYYFVLKKGVSQEQVKKAFEKDKCYKYWEDMISFGNSKLDPIEFTERYGKYHEEDYTDLFVFLAKYLEKDSIIKFTGEDAEHWRILFDGKGSYSEQPATIIYDYHPFKTFMKEFEKEMPKKLKKELEKWHRGVEVLNKI